MASRRHDIIRPITPWVQKEEGFETRKNVDNRRETVKWGEEREIETKHINSGIGGLTAHILFCFGFFSSFFPREKTTAAMNVFPMNLQLQAWTNRITHTQTAATTAAAAETGVFYSLS